MSLNGQNSLILRRTKRHNSCTTDDALKKFQITDTKDILTEVTVHYHTMVIYIQYKFIKVTKLWF